MKSCGFDGVIISDALDHARAFAAIASNDDWTQASAAIELIEERRFNRDRDLVAALEEVALARPDLIVTWDYYAAPALAEIAPVVALPTPTRRSGWARR